MIYGDNPKSLNNIICKEKIVEPKLNKIELSNGLIGIFEQDRDNSKLLPDINSITQSSNLYVYCANNPLTYIDPNGRSLILAIGGITIAGTTILKGVAFVLGTTAGIIMAVDLGKKVVEVLRTRKGSIQNAPKPPGTPGWDAIRDLTMAEILRRAQNGEPGFRTIWKLLNDGRFKK